VVTNRKVYKWRNYTNLWGKMAKIITRRGLLKATGAGLVGLLGSGCLRAIEFLPPSYQELDRKPMRPLNYQNEMHATKAEGIDSRFLPNNIPGVACVSFHTTQGSKYCLVHILQKHWSNDKVMLQEDVNEVIDTQQDIHDMLSYLMDNHGLKQVYAERDREEIELQLEDIRILKHCPDYTHRRGLLKGADFLLAFDRGLRLLPGETLETSREAKEFYRRLKNGERVTDEEYKRIVFENREDALLEIISASDDPLAVTVYGGLHDWMDNIKRWNKDNPDKMFSYIRITPIHYPTEIEEN